MPSVKTRLAEADPLKYFADQLRERKGVPWAEAKFEVHDGEPEKVEYFRGKDFARHLRAHPEKMDSLPFVKQERGVEDQIRDVANAMVQRGLVTRATRKYKRPKPGLKRLVKYPRTLEVSRVSTWDEASFYVWRYDRPTSVWFYLGSFALPVAVILACLFPLAPWWLRMAAVYGLMALLAFMLGVLALRYTVFGALWMATGHSLWIFPNMMSDEVSVLDAFSPLLSYERPKGGILAQLKQRLVAAVVAAGVLYVLYAHTPDVAHLQEEARRAHDSLFDYLDLAGKHKSFLEGGTNATGTAGAGAGPAAGAKAGPH